MEMRKLISSTLAFAIFFAGCAGREANPMPVYLPGDENRSCTALKSEVAQLQADMERLLPKTNKGLTNALWGAAGVFTLGIGFFFMDLKDAEKIEFDAMRQRHNRLLVYAAEKGCDMAGVRAERIPSLKEQKEAVTKTETGDKVADGSIGKLKEYTQDVEQEIYCANCNEKIGKLEEPLAFNEHIVCGTCYEKLKKQMQIQRISY
jgi:predicted nucleic acid-binding Zn ribbon protein